MFFIVSGVGFSVCAACWLGCVHEARRLAGGPMSRPDRLTDAR